MPKVLEIDLIFFQKKSLVLLCNDVLAVVAKRKWLYGTASDN